MRIDNWELVRLFDHPFECLRMRGNLHNHSFKNLVEGAEIITSKIIEVKKKDIITTSTGYLYKLGKRGKQL